jgi:hypothetical protein
VVVERDTARAELSRIGLADVMEQSRKPESQSRGGLLDHCDRVRQNILVVVDRVALEGQSGKLLDELVCQSGRNEAGLVHPMHGGHCLVGRGKAQRRYEAEQPQHPQWVVTKRNFRIQRGPQQARLQVAKAAGWIDHLGCALVTAWDAYAHCVDGEVAAEQILLDTL